MALAGLNANLLRFKLVLHCSEPLQRKMSLLSEPALWQLDDTYEGFDWIDFHDADNSVVSFLRKSREGEMIAFVVNATPQVRYNYRLGVPESGFWREIINTDAETYGGSNVGNYGGVRSENVPWMAREHSLLIHLPPLATVAFKLER